jgi:hypothetical protein
MIPDPLTSGRLFWTWRRGSAPAHIERSYKNRLSWRLSLLVILVLSLGLWAAIWEGIAALVRGR